MMNPDLNKVYSTQFSRALPCKRSPVILVWLLLGGTCSGFAETDFAALSEQARQAMSAQRFEEAAEIYSRMANSYPNEPMLLSNLGIALHLSSQDEEAVSPLRKATEAMPESFQAHFFLGASLTRLGLYKEAISPLRQAGKLDANNPFVPALLADALEATGQFQAAINSWLALQGIDETNSFAYAGLLRCYENLAAQAVESLLQQDPESGFLLRLVAESRFSQQQYPSAFFLFRQALQQQPNVREVHEAIAEIYDRTGNGNWAAIERQRIESLSESDCSQSSSLDCLYRAGKYKAVLGATAGSDQESLFWSTRAYSRLAEGVFQDLKSLPDTFDKFRQLADILLSRNKYSEAVGITKQALELRPGHPQIERQLAELLFLAGRNQEARPLLEKFRGLEPNNPSWPTMLGNLLVAEQQFDQAIPLLEDAIAQPDSTASARLALGRSYLAVGRPVDAIANLAAASAQDPDGSVHYQLAQAYQRSGDRTRAGEALQIYRERSERNQRETEDAASLEILAPE